VTSVGYGVEQLVFVWVVSCDQSQCKVQLVTILYVDFLFISLILSTLNRRVAWKDGKGREGRGSRVGSKPSGDFGNRSLQGQIHLLLHVPCKRISV
jgi:hypothetical protein